MNNNLLLVIVVLTILFLMYLCNNSPTYDEMFGAPRTSSATKYRPSILFISPDHDDLSEIGTSRYREVSTSMAITEDQPISTTPAVTSYLPPTVSDPTRKQRFEYDYYDSDDDTVLECTD